MVEQRIANTINRFHLLSYKKKRSRITAKPFQ